MPVRVVVITCRPLTVLARGQELLGLTQGRLGLQLIQRLAQLLHLVGLLLHALQQSGRCGLQELRRLVQHALAALHALQAQLAAGGLDPAHAGGHAEISDFDPEGDRPWRCCPHGCRRRTPWSSHRPSPPPGRCRRIFRRTWPRRPSSWPPQWAAPRCTTG